ncbi:hypothetical protein Tco_0328917 [Tanacetum coccineum]
MSTQQDIYAAGFENRPPMFNKDNYVPWSSRLLRYVKSKPNGKLIYYFIMNGPYVRRIIPEPIKQMEADDQAIQIILMGLPEDIYVAVDSCETTQEIWFTSTNGESIESYYRRFSKLMNDFKRNKHFPEKIASNLKFLNNLQPKWRRHVTIVHQTKDLHEVDYTQLYDFLKYNQAKVNELRAERLARAHDPLALMIAQPVMNLGQDRQIQMVRGNRRNQFRQYDGQNVRNLNGYNAVQNNELIVVSGIPNPIANQNGNGNVVAARVEGDLDEIEEVNANCILMANLQQASTSDTQIDKAPIYDSDGSAEVHEYDNCYNNEIFNMFTQEEQYIDLLELILEPHQVQQNDNNVISVVSILEQSGGIVEQNPNIVEETCAYFKSLYNNLAIEVEKVNTVNRKMKEKNVDLTTELARYKIQENVNQVDARLQNFKIQFLKEATKFVRDFESLAKEADESLAKHKALEFEIERLLRAVVS